jgi:hypothetical protein
MLFLLLYILALNITLPHLLTTVFLFSAVQKTGKESSSSSVSASPDHANRSLFKPVKKVKMPLVRIMFFVLWTQVIFFDDARKYPMIQVFSKHHEKYFRP